MSFSFNSWYFDSGCLSTYQVQDIWKTKVKNQNFENDEGQKDTRSFLYIKLSSIFVHETYIKLRKKWHKIKFINWWLREKYLNIFLFPLHTLKFFIVASLLFWHESFTHFLHTINNSTIWIYVYVYLNLFLKFTLKNFIFFSFKIVEVYFLIIYLFSAQSNESELIFTLAQLLKKGFIFITGKSRVKNLVIYSLYWTK